MHMSYPVWSVISVFESDLTVDIVLLVCTNQHGIVDAELYRVDRAQSSSVKERTLESVFQ